MKICICGGGNLGHVCAGFLANRGNLVSLLTTKPERWNSELEIVAPDGVLTGKLTLISSYPEEVIPQAEMVLVCLPGFAIQDELEIIKPHLSNEAIVGTVVSSTGFFFEALKILSPDIPLFGFQRVPFISRIIEYGKKAELKGYKESLHVAIENTSEKESFREKLEKLFEKLELEIPAATAEQFEALKNSVNPIRLKNFPASLDADTIDVLYHKILNGE